MATKTCDNASERLRGIGAPDPIFRRVRDLRSGSAGVLRSKSKLIKAGINDHQIDIVPRRAVGTDADHSWSGTRLDIVSEVTASKNDRKRNDLTASGCSHILARKSS